MMAARSTSDGRNRLRLPAPAGGRRSAGAVESVPTPHTRPAPGALAANVRARVWISSYRKPKIQNPKWRAGPRPALSRPLIFLATLLSAGCARPAGEIFPPVFPPIVFPPPPSTARLAFVGQLQTERDLQPAVSGWQAFSAVVTGPPESRGVSAPSGLCVSRAGRVYVTDPPLRRLHIFDLKSRAYRAVTAAGATPLAVPADVAVMGGRVYLTDAGRGTIDVFTELGEPVTSYAGLALQRPVGLAATPDETQLVVVEAAGHGCAVVSADGRLVRRFGRRGAGPGEFNVPTFAVCGDEQSVWVSDSMNARVQCVGLDGAARTGFGRKGDAAGDLSLPKGVALDAAGHVYVVDAHFENVQVFDRAGRLLMSFGGEGSAPGRFWLPAKAFIDHEQRLWIADSYNRRVQVFRIMNQPSEPTV